MYFPASKSTRSSGLALMSMLLLNNINTAAALNPSCNPGGNFDLTKWSLQQPHEPQYVDSGTIQNCGGYHSDSFYTDKGDGSLVLKAPGDPSKCSHTPNSQHCRSELREVSPGSWDPHTPVNRLSADLKMVKNEGSVCIGQIHIDGAISKKPVAELYYYSNGDLKVGVQKCARDDCSQNPAVKIDNVPKGQRFTYEIRYENNKLSVVINNKAPKFLDVSALNGVKSYFKAGNYNQGNGDTEVHFYAIRVTHDKNDAGSNPSNPGNPSNPNCDGAPAVDQDNTVVIRMFGETDCCHASQTTKLGVLDSCHNADAPFQGLNQAVGQKMFGRNIQIVAYESSNCAGGSDSFHLTNQPQCLQTGKTYKSYKISAS